MVFDSFSGSRPAYRPPGGEVDRFICADRFEPPGMGRCVPSVPTATGAACTGPGSTDVAPWPIRGRDGWHIPPKGSLTGRRRQTEKPNGKTEKGEGKDQRPDTGGRGSGRQGQHRAPEGEGVRSPFASESDGPPQTSVFDSMGNESVVVLTEDNRGAAVRGHRAHVGGGRHDGRPDRAR
jgi:hypothetical protein